MVIFAYVYTQHCKKVLWYVGSDQATAHKLSRLSWLTQFSGEHHQTKLHRTMFANRNANKTTLHFSWIANIPDGANITRKCTEGTWNQSEYSNKKKNRKKKRKHPCDPTNWMKRSKPKKRPAKSERWLRFSLNTLAWAFRGRSRWVAPHHVKPKLG